MRVAVFGLGSFGRHVAVELARAGHDVLALDSRQDRVQAVRDSVSQAVVGEATDRQVLESLGLSGADAAVISLGSNLAGSILLTLYLQELKVGRILVKAVSDDHALVLKKVGAKETIFPEREMARRLALSLSHPNMLDFLPLGADLAIVEVALPAGLAGKSIRELDLRRRMGIQVLALKSGSPEKVRPVVDPEVVLKAGDRLIVLGRPDDIDKLREKS